MNININRIAYRRLEDLEKSMERKPLIICGAR